MKEWLKTEDGRNALELIRDIPEVLQVCSEHGRSQIAQLERQILEMNVRSPEKDREFVVKMSELAGAKNMLNSFIGLLSKSKENKTGKD